VGTAFVVESYICHNCEKYIRCQGCDKLFNTEEEAANYSCSNCLKEEYDQILKEERGL